MEPRLIWINLLVKLGVAAAVSSSLVRSVAFKALLFREERSLLQKTYLVAWFSLPIMVGAWIRFSVNSFVAGDLGFETALLLVQSATLEIAVTEDLEINQPQTDDQQPEAQQSRQGVEPESWAARRVTPSHLSSQFSVLNSQ